MPFILPEISKKERDDEPKSVHRHCSVIVRDSVLALAQLAVRPIKKNLKMVFIMSDMQRGWACPGLVQGLRFQCMDHGCDPHAIEEPMGEGDADAGIFLISFGKVGHIPKRQREFIGDPSTGRFGCVGVHKK